MFRLFRKISSGTNKKGVFHLHPNQNFRNFLVNGKRPMFSRWRMKITRFLRRQRTDRFINLLGSKNYYVRARMESYFYLPDGLDHHFRTIHKRPSTNKQDEEEGKLLLRKKHAGESLMWIKKTSEFAVRVKALLLN